MYFRNLRVYRLHDQSGTNLELGALENALTARPFKPCGPLDFVSRGWTPPRGAGAPMVHTVGGQHLIALGAENKLLTGAVVRAEVAKRAAKIEAEQQRKVGRKELRDLRDRVTEELLPRAFVSHRITWCWIDPINRLLVIDTGSAARAEELLEHLTKSLDGIAMRPLLTAESPAAAMTEWLQSGDAPAGFTVDRDCELRSAAGGGGAQIRYVHHSLDGAEIPAHISAGKVATRLAMTWQDRISFVLTEKLEIKRLTFLDILKEEASQAADTAADQFDADFALMTGELARLLGDLTAALGGVASDA